MRYHKSWPGMVLYWATDCLGGVRGTKQFEETSMKVRLRCAVVNGDMALEERIECAMMLLLCWWIYDGNLHSKSSGSSLFSCSQRWNRFIASPSYINYVYLLPSSHMLWRTVARRGVREQTSRSIWFPMWLLFLDLTSALADAIFEEPLIAHEESCNTSSPTRNSIQEASM